MILSSISLGFFGTKMYEFIINEDVSRAQYVKIWTQSYLLFGLAFFLYYVVPFKFHQAITHALRAFEYPFFSYQKAKLREIMFSRYGKRCCAIKI